MPFAARVPSVFETAERAPGFVCRGKSQQTVDASGHLVKLGYDAVPVFYPDPALVIQTLSVWRDIESVRAYVYSGGHLEALRKRADWMVKTVYPQYVLWRRPGADTPLYAEGVARLEHLHAHGPTANAFTFVQRFKAPADVAT